MKKNINKTATILLLITVGFFGVHSFYQGKKTQGILYILAFTLGWFLFLIPPIIAYIYLLVEFYKLLTQTDEEFARKNSLEYIPEQKNGLMAGAITLLGGIFGLHFSYLNNIKAAKNRFLISLVIGILGFLGYCYYVYTLSLSMSNGMDGFNNSEMTQLFSSMGLMFIPYIGLVVLSIISLVEAYNYFKYGFKDDHVMYSK